MDNKLPVNISKALTFVNEKSIRYLDTKKEANKYTGIFLTELQKNKSLLSCSEDSIITALMSSVYFNLLPNTPKGYAYLIPYKGQLRFQLGYRGLIELAYRSGTISVINSELVFKEDVFEVEYGTSRSIKHIPDFTIDRTNTNNMTLVYATLKYKNGDTDFVVLNKVEIDKIVDFINKKNNNVISDAWKNWPDQMIKKTAIKRLLKYHQQDQIILSKAIEVDNVMESGGTVVYNKDTYSIETIPKKEIPKPTNKNDNKFDIESLKESIDENSVSDYDNLINIE